jgi:hypothetical protein
MLCNSYKLYRLSMKLRITTNYNYRMPKTGLQTLLQAKKTGRLRPVFLITGYLFYAPSRYKAELKNVV